MDTEEGSSGCGLPAPLQIAASGPCVLRSLSPTPHIPMSLEEDPEGARLEISLLPLSPEAATLLLPSSPDTAPLSPWRPLLALVLQPRKRQKWVQWVYGEREEEVGGHGGALSTGSLLESTQAAFKIYLCHPGALAVVHHYCVQIGFVLCWSPPLHPQSSQSPIIRVSPA